jgi:cysteine desulfurase
VVFLQVDRDGLINLAALEAALAVPTQLVSVMAANNEIGVLQPIEAIAALAHAHGALFHTDAAQAAGKIPLDVRTQGIDLLSISGHKLYAPKGIGALYVRHRPRIRLRPLLHGGGQERALRPGTLAAPLIVALGEACAIAGREMPEEAPRLAAMRDGMLAAMREAIPGLRLNGAGAPRLPGNLNVTLPGIPARALMALCPDLCLSTGSACHSGEVTASHVPSHVQIAIGLGEEAAACTLRIGLGRFTSQAECDAAVKAILAAAQQIETSPCPK